MPNVYKCVNMITNYKITPKIVDICLRFIIFAVVKRYESVM